MSISNDSLRSMPGQSMTGPTISPFVEGELAQDRRYHPNLGGITRGGLANHFPMTLLALHGLGASDSEVRAFIRVWPRHRTPVADERPSGLALVDNGRLTAHNWPEFLGQGEYLVEFRRVFQAALDGPEGLGVVSRALAVMRDGLPMGLFHPLIRLSFAVSHGDHGLIADALAYMAIRHVNLYRAALPVSDSDATRSGASVWRDLATADAASKFLLGGGTIRVCEELCGSAALHSAAFPPGFGITQGSLGKRMSEIALLALRIYVHRPALSTLHAVTSCQALAELTNHLGAEHPVFADLWARYWVWLTALYVEKGAPSGLPVARHEQTPKESWPTLAARARAIPEVHLIKMTYSCRWLDETFGPDPLYKSAVLDMLREQAAHPKAGGTTAESASL